MTHDDKEPRNEERVIGVKVLEEINGIDKFGVFSDYIPSGGKLSFLKFNLLYGWNGSGKTTLSRAFDSFSGKVPDAFPEGTFKATIDKRQFCRETINQSDLKIAVFNQDFVKRNLDFDTQKAKSILYISEEKIEDKNKLQQKQDALKITQSALNQKTQQVNKLKDDISSELTKAAKNIKNSFGLIQTNNTKFLNYNKTKLETFIAASSPLIKTENILLPEILEKKRLSAQATQKANVTKLVFDPLKSDLAAHLATFKAAIEKRIVANQIQKLIEDDALNKWVATGLSLHKDKSDKVCEFCGGEIRSERIKELESHFSDEYQTSLNELTVGLVTVAELIAKFTISGADSGDFYVELQEDVKTNKSQIDTTIKRLKQELVVIQVKLSEKKENPFKIISLPENTIISDFDSLVNAVNCYNSNVADHNSKSSDFTASVSAANDALELHFICQQMQDGSLAGKKGELKIADIELADLTKRHETSTSEIRLLESQLVNAAIAADIFNKELERFIGRSDITLEFRKELGGYQFKRNGRKEPASNLSEGEKTAIAFIYFITKLKESGSDLEKTVVALDDPISSFDSNHLHHAFGFIRQHLDGAQQLIVLTHNFEFFKLIRDWLKGKNPTDEPDKNKSQFFLIQTKPEDSRKSEVVPLPKILLNYESEYHFIFSKVLRFRGKENLSFEDSHFIGNGSRKILEAFLAFKYPSYKADFAGLLSKACGTDKVLFHKVYSFINKYSHSKTLEVFSMGSDNIFSESKNIAEEVFGIVKKLDATHFEEMEKLCNSLS